MSGRYAERTSVPVDRSRAEIEKLLVKHGAHEFVSGWDHSQNRAVVGFVMKNLQVRILLSLPDREARNYEQEHRRYWRALVLVIKAKLEAIASGISTFEREFLPDIVVTESGQTFGQMLIPRIAQITASGKLPPLLTAGGETA